MPFSIATPPDPVPSLVLVVARADNGVIGRDGGLPWRLSPDLRRFKSITIGKPVVMGRKTFESIGKPLPERRNIVLTGDAVWRADGVEVAADLDAALTLAGNATEICVIGGAQVYAQALPRAKRIELTEVHAAPDGDTVLPPFGPEWFEIARLDRPAEGDAPAHSFVTLERRA